MPVSNSINFRIVHKATVTLPLISAATERKLEDETPVKPDKLVMPKRLLKNTEPVTPQKIEYVMKLFHGIV